MYCIHCIEKSCIEKSHALRNAYSKHKKRISACSLQKKPTCIIPAKRYTEFYFHKRKLHFLTWACLMIHKQELIPNELLLYYYEVIKHFTKCRTIHLAQAMFQSTTARLFKAGLFSSMDQITRDQLFSSMGGPLPPWTAFQVSWDIVTEATELACLNLPTCGHDTICSHVFTSTSQPRSKEVLPLAVTGRARKYL